MMGPQDRDRQRVKDEDKDMVGEDRTRHDTRLTKG
jgi:hypothetical protein